MNFFVVLMIILSTLVYSNAFENCYEIKDGHSFDNLNKSIRLANKAKGKPIVIIAHTIKGKGIKDFENDPGWHARKVKGKEEIIGKKELKII